MKLSCLAQKLSNLQAVAILVNSTIFALLALYNLYQNKTVDEWIVVLILLPLLYLPLYALSMVVVLFSRNYINEKIAEYAGLILAFAILPLWLLKYFEPHLIYISVPILALFHLLMILSKGCNADIIVEDIITEDQF